MRIGVHVSIAGGIERAPERARALRCESVQVFTKSNLQWAAAPVRAAQYEEFRSRCAEVGLGPNIGHACYLLNLATPDSAAFDRSIRTLVLEYRRAHRMRLSCLVLHPGAHLGTGEQQGLRRIAHGLRRVLAQARTSTVKLALETTSGAGTALGWRFEHLAQIIDRVGHTERLGVCFDLCHVFAAGYDLRTRPAYRSTMRQFDQVIGLDRICAFHFNDSKGELSSRLDRHQHIGHGNLGEAPFRFVLRDRRFRRVPAILETPKHMRGKTHWDAINLRTLRRLRGDRAVTP